MVGLRTKIILYTLTYKKLLNTTTSPPNKNYDATAELIDVQPTNLYTVDADKIAQGILPVTHLISSPFRALAAVVALFLLIGYRK